MKLKTALRKYPNASKTQLMELTGLSYYKLNKELELIEALAPFTNSNGFFKQQARQIMVSAIAESKLFGKVLSLPFETCHIERMLIEDVSKKLKFVGCEIEEDVYFKMLETVAKYKLKMNCVYGSIGEQIAKARENEYSHLILDYCGQLNSFHTDIKMAMENKIVEVGGTISITLNRRKTVVGGIEDQINALTPYADLENRQVENALLHFLAMNSGGNYAIEKVFPYKDKGKQQMILVVVKRVK